MTRIVWATLRSISTWCGLWECVAHVIHCVSCWSRGWGIKIRSNPTSDWRLYISTELRLPLGLAWFVLYIEKLTEILNRMSPQQFYMLYCLSISFRWQRYMPNIYCKHQNITIPIYMWVPNFSNNGMENSIHLYHARNVKWLLQKHI